MADKKIKVTLVKSVIGTRTTAPRCAGSRLRRLNNSAPFSRIRRPCGMIRKVAYP